MIPRLLKWDLSPHWTPQKRKYCGEKGRDIQSETEKGDWPNRLVPRWAEAGAWTGGMAHDPVCEGRKPLDKIHFEGKRSQTMTWLGQNASIQGKGNFNHSVLSITWISPRRSRREAVNKNLKCYLRWLYSKEWQKATPGSFGPNTWVLGADMGQCSKRKVHQLPQSKGFPDHKHMLHTPRDFQKHFN